jgi:hypothetical protein
MAAGAPRFRVPEVWNDEWLVGRRYLSRESIAALYADEDRPSGLGDAGPPASVGSAGRRRKELEVVTA